MLSLTKTLNKQVEIFYANIIAFDHFSLQSKEEKKNATHLVSFAVIEHEFLTLNIKINLITLNFYYFQIGFVMYLLYQMLGISAVIGSTVCILTMIPLQFFIGKRMSTNAKLTAVSLTIFFFVCVCVCVCVKTSKQAKAYSGVVISFSQYI